MDAPNLRGTPVVVLGASGHAKVVIDVLRRQALYALIGVAVRDLKDAPEHFCGLPILGIDDELPAFRKQHDVITAIVAVGDNAVRKTIVARLRHRYSWLQYATAIHPSAQIGDDVSVGQGTVIMAGTVINSGTRVGEFCIVNSSASVDHDNVINDFASLAPGVVTGGNVTIGSSAAVCLGARIIHNCEIGRQSVIGSGAVVLSDIAADSVAYGIPARVIRARAASEPYL